jgi:hypothetical protein
MDMLNHASDQELEQLLMTNYNDQDASFNKKNLKLYQKCLNTRTTTNPNTLICYKSILDLKSKKGLGDSLNTREEQYVPTSSGWQNI